MSGVGTEFVGTFSMTGSHSRPQLCFQVPDNFLFSTGLEMIDVICMTATHYNLHLVSRQQYTLTHTHLWALGYVIEYIFLPF